MVDLSAFRYLAQHRRPRARPIPQRCNPEVTIRRRHSCSCQQRVDVLRVAQPVVGGKGRPRHEVVNKSYLCCFQLIRTEKAADSRQVRNELRVIRLAPIAHRVEAIDKITSILKLRRAEEGGRHVDPVTSCVSGRTVIDNSLPGGKAWRVRFAIKEVEILLAYKEWCGINWIRPIRDLVVVDGHGS